MQLFARDSRGTALTAAGTRLLDDARSLLAESKALQQRLFRATNPAMTVTVGTMPGLLATAAALAFETGDPSRRAVVVQVGWRNQVDIVRRGDADVVYAREPIDHTGLGTAALLDEPRDAVLHVDHPLAARPLLRLADLAATRLLQEPTTVPEWSTLASPELRRESARAAVHTMEQKLELVAAQAGFAVLPRSTAAFYRRPDVAVIPVADLGPSRVTLIWDATVANPVRDDFVTAALACRDQTI